MRMLTALLFFLVLTGAGFAADCWDQGEVSEIDGFSDLNNVVILSVKDAVDCRPVTDAVFTLGSNTLKTDSRGYIVIPADGLAEVEDMRIPVRFSKPGYMDYDTSLNVQIGLVLNRRFLMSKQIAPSSMRFVLQWGKHPEDLDLHVTGDGFHVSYQDMRSVPNKAMLDRDDRSSYGPETITLEKVLPSQTYHVYVKNYSKSPCFEDADDAVVTVYRDGRAVQELTLPKTEESVVEVLTVSGGQVVPVNKPVNTMR